MQVQAARVVYETDDVNKVVVVAPAGNGLIRRWTAVRHALFALRYSQAYVLGLTQKLRHLLRYAMAVHAANLQSRE